MIPARARKTVKFAWDPAWEKKRMHWMFLVLDRNAPRRRKVVEDLTHFGYYTDEYGWLTPGVVTISLRARLTREQLYAEVMRVHKACDRLGLEGLDDVDVEDIEALPLHWN